MIESKNKRFRFNRVMSLTTSVFVGPIRTILLSVTEQPPLYTISITTSEESILTQRLIRKQQRLHLPLLVLQLAILHGILPIASLLIDIEVQTSGTTDRLKPLQYKRQSVLLR